MCSSVDIGAGEVSEDVGWVSAVGDGAFSGGCENDEGTEGRVTKDANKRVTSTNPRRIGNL